MRRRLNHNPRQDICYGLRTMVYGLAVMFALISPASATQIDDSAWDGLLHRYSKDGLVDYQGVKAEQAVLDGYLASVGKANPSTWSKEEQLAFWINAYNACVFHHVLAHYPLKSVRSVKGFFDGDACRVGGELLTLNRIEERGRMLGDWRIHFAVVCASSSCPLLRSEAYAPQRLEEQLADQTKQFLSFPERGARVEAGTLWLSKIFDWYAKDFLAGGGPLQRWTADKFLTVARPYLTPELIAAMDGKRLGIKFMPYDWTLNEMEEAIP